MSGDPMAPARPIRQMRLCATNGINGSVTGRLIESLQQGVYSSRGDSIRLSGIDAPEKAQPFGQRSKESLSSLVFDKAVTVEWSKRDKYGRIVGKVLIDGTDANLEQIKAGMAWFYRRYAKELPSGGCRDLRARRICRTQPKEGPMGRRDVYAAVGVAKNSLAP
jgi:endonuclease YncB( thermonuclease family)